MTRWTKELTIKRISRDKFLRAVNCGVDLKRISGHLDPYFVCKQNLHPVCTMYHGWVRGNHAYIGAYSAVGGFYTPTMVFFRLAYVDGRIVLPWAHTRNSLDWDLIHHERFLDAVKYEKIRHYRETDVYKIWHDKSQYHSADSRKKALTYHRRLVGLNKSPVIKSRQLCDKMSEILMQMQNSPFEYARMTSFFKVLVLGIEHELVAIKKQTSQKRGYSRRLKFLKNFFSMPHRTHTGNKGWPRYNYGPANGSLFNTMDNIELSKRWMHSKHYASETVTSFLNINKVFEPVFLLSGNWGKPNVL